MNEQTIKYNTKKRFFCYYFKRILMLKTIPFSKFNFRLTKQIKSSSRIQTIRSYSISQDENNHKRFEQETKLINLFLPYAKQRTEMNYTLKVSNWYQTPKVNNMIISENMNSNPLIHSVEDEIQLDAVDLNNEIRKLTDSSSRVVPKNLLMDRIVNYVIDPMPMPTPIKPTTGIKKKGKFKKKLNKISYVRLLFYASKFGTISQVSRLFDIFMTTKLTPSIDMFNYAMLCNRHDFSSNKIPEADPEIMIRLLQGIIKCKLNVNQNTWLVIFMNLKNDELKELLFNQMVKRKISLDGIITKIIKWRLNLNQTRTEIITWCEKKGIQIDTKTFSYLFNNSGIIEAFTRLPLRKDAVIQDNSFYEEFKASKAYFTVKEYDLDDDVYSSPNNIIKETLNMKYLYHDYVLKDVLKMVKKIIKLKASELNQESWNSIIHFLLSNYQFEYVKTLFQNHIALFTIDRNLLGLLLWHSLSSGQLKHKEIVISILENNRSLLRTITTDSSTWNLLMDSVKETDQKLALVEIMKNYNVRTKEMNIFSIRAKYEQTNDMEEVMNWCFETRVVIGEQLHTEVVSFLVRFYLKEQRNYERAVELVKEQGAQLVPLLVNHFIYYFKELGQIQKAITLLDLYHMSGSISDDLFRREFGKFIETKSKFKERSLNQNVVQELIHDFPELESGNRKKEEEIISKFLDLDHTILIKNKYDYYASRSLKRKAKLPPSLSASNIDKYLKGSVVYNGHDISRLVEYINGVNISELKTNSISNFIRFLSFSLQSDEIFKILDEMKSLGKKPTRRDLNYILVLTTKLHFNKTRILRILDEFSINKIKPDTSTWYILFQTLTDTLTKSNFIDTIIENKIPIDPITHELVDAKYTEFKNIEQLKSWLHFNRLCKDEFLINNNYITSALFDLYVKEQRPLDAIKLLFENSPLENFTPPRLDRLMQYYMNKYDFIGAYLALEFYLELLNSTDKFERLTEFANENGRSWNFKDLEMMSEINERDQQLLKIYKSRSIEFRKNITEISLEFEAAASKIYEHLNLCEQQMTQGGSEVYKILTSEKPKLFTRTNFEDFALTVDLIDSLHGQPPKAIPDIVKYFSNFDINTLNENSIQKLLEFFALNRYFIETSKLLTKIKSSEYFEITTDNMNVAIYSDLENGDYYRLIDHLKEMKDLGLPVNRSTWYLIYHKIEDESTKKRFAMKLLALAS